MLHSEVFCFTNTELENTRPLELSGQTFTGPDTKTTGLGPVAQCKIRALLICLQEPPASLLLCLGLAVVMKQKLHLGLPCKQKHLLTMVLHTMEFCTYYVCATMFIFPEQLSGAYNFLFTV